jgi:hypothetical protein
MKIETMEKILDFLEEDTKQCIKDEYHARCHDLLNVIMYEELPELIKFVRKVNKALNTPLPNGTGDNYHGFKMAIETLKREIYE